ncbi:hypothetical protein Zmor_006485 [Zophobas morio]|uniref:Uncharacterized protein n=1 Tax=Zophobas morio TaxID=2755281 RepID=A0AA38IXA8_9CUCU|nr:hypothetical protein Zmor_006485 [Zophobas morio]
MFDDDMDCNPPELGEAAKKGIGNLLPEKSKSRYQKAYQAYTDWCAQNKVQNITSENVILAYFGVLSQDKKPSTLWTSYSMSMLQTTLNIKQILDNSKFGKLIAYLKKFSL